MTINSQREKLVILDLDNTLLQQIDLRNFMLPLYVRQEMERCEIKKLEETGRLEIDGGLYTFTSVEDYKKTHKPIVEQMNAGNIVHPLLMRFYNVRHFSAFVRYAEAEKRKPLHARTCFPFQISSSAPSDCITNIKVVLLRPGVRAFLKSLNEAGYKMGVWSAGGMRPIQMLVEECLWAKGGYEDGYVLPAPEFIWDWALCNKFHSVRTGKLIGYDKSLNRLRTHYSASINLFDVVLFDDRKENSSKDFPDHLIQVPCFEPGSLQYSYDQYLETQALADVQNRFSFLESKRISKMEQEQQTAIQIKDNNLNMSIDKENATISTTSNPEFILNAPSCTFSAPIYEQSC